MSLIVGACKWLRDNQQNYDLLFDRNQDKGTSNTEKEESLDGFPSWVNNFQEAQKRNYIQTKKEAREKIMKAFNKKPSYKATTEKKQGTEKDDLEELIDYESENEDEDFGLTTKKSKLNPRGDPNEDEDSQNDDFKVQNAPISKYNRSIDNICHKNTFPT